jgi:hypothetical protein
MRVGLPDPDEFQLVAECADAVEQFRGDLEQVASRGDAPASGEDGVGDVGDVGGLAIVAAEPEDDALPALPAVAGELDHGLLDQLPADHPVCRRREVVVTHAALPMYS